MTSETECSSCGNEEPEYKSRCPFCEAFKCDVCDMGDDCACINCEGQA